jgi:hypothetical protein
VSFDDFINPEKLNIEKLWFFTTKLQLGRNEMGLNSSFA